MILFISGELLFVLLLLLIVGISWIIDNLLWIILIAVVVNIVIPLIMYKYPELLLGVTVLLIIVGIIGIIGIYISNRIEINSTTVTIYKATADCAIFDESGDNVTIPKDAIVAIFRHPEQASTEKNYVGNSSMCYWYNGGSVHATTVSVLREFSSTTSLLPNKWNIKEIRKITYKEFMKGDWWKFD